MGAHDAVVPQDLQKCKRPWCLSSVSVPETSSALVPSSVSECVYKCLYLQGYSFMAPSILFKRNAVMDDPAQLCGRSERPGSAAVARSAMMKVSLHIAAL